MSKATELRKRMRRDLTPELIGTAGNKGFYRIVLGREPAVPYMFWADSPEDAIEQMAQCIEYLSVTIQSLKSKHGRVSR